MTTTTAPPVKVSPRTVRMRPHQLWYWNQAIHNIYWRRGPNTPDGFWMVSKVWNIAVRVVRDTEAPDRTAAEFGAVMDDAVHAQHNDAEDAYLESLTLAAALPMAELERIKRRVTTGRAGGAKDGAK